MTRWRVIVAGFAGLAALLAVLVVRHFNSEPNRNECDDCSEAWFADVTDEVGIDFAHDAGDLSRYQQPQAHGSGVAIFDFDGDNKPDIYLLTFGGENSKSINRLYKNTGSKFVDVTEGSGLGISGFNTGVAIGDINNDGRPDVLVTQHGGVRLFLNEGNGHFRDITEQSGLKNPLWATSACFFDYDRDGWLDLIVVNYLEDDPTWVCRNPMGKRDYCGPLQFPATASKLFHNEPDGKGGRRFVDVTVKAGLAKKRGPGLGVYCADFNGDGWPDIFIANDGKPNHLWINQKKNGTFEEEALSRGIAVDSNAQAQAGMGVAAGDVDGDGLFDIYVTHLTRERNTLWRQGPERGRFSDETARFGLMASDWRATGFGTLMGDFDQNGWLDIAVVNGRVEQGTSTPNAALGDHFKDYTERNQLFSNENGRFRDVSGLNSPFCGTPNMGRGLAAGDLDGDGALDLVVTTVANRARVFRNVARNRGHWLIVRAVDPRLKRDAYGAEVRVVAGDRRWLRIINPADSFQSSSDPRAHFGLGAVAKYDSIHVLWPDGFAEIFDGDAADQPIELLRGNGHPAPGPRTDK